MKLPKWAKSQKPHDLMLRERRALIALEIAIITLEGINKSFTTNPNEDCRGCEFGPCQSTVHIPGCDYLEAHEALDRIKKLDKPEPKPKVKKVKSLLCDDGIAGCTCNQSSSVGC